jgi:trehalose 6-phosphate synthase
VYPVEPRIPFVSRSHSALESPLVVASNRGPLSYIQEGESLQVERGSGGLVTALAGVLFEADATWVAAAMSEQDRRFATGAAAPGDGPGRMRFVDIPAEHYENYYNGISNGVLWFAHHYLWDVVRHPVFGRDTLPLWESYRHVNQLFADALDDESSREPVFLVQDYHLALVPGLLRKRRPDAKIAHFSHTPFAGSTYLQLLPAEMRHELLRGMLGADVLGFQAEHWAENFLLCCRELPEAHVDLRRRRVSIDGRRVLVRTYPVALDPGPLRVAAASPEVRAFRQEITERRGDRKLLLRVDRFELSKNIERGFLAFGDFLNQSPQWRGRVKFLALLPPSRTSMPEYREYAKRCFAAAASVNRAHGNKSWTPIDLVDEESYPRAVSAYGLYDVLLVNPVFDGMNLVAMEGPLVNRQRGALVLSRNAGAWARLGRHALGVNPFDVGETADAIRTALEMPADERARRQRGLVRQVLAHSPARWLHSQLRDLDAVRGLSSEHPQEREESGGSDDREVGGPEEGIWRLWPPDGDLGDEESIGGELV